MQLAYNNDSGTQPMGTCAPVRDSIGPVQFAARTRNVSWSTAPNLLPPRGSGTDARRFFDARGADARQWLNGGLVAAKYEAQPRGRAIGPPPW